MPKPTGARMLPVGLVEQPGQLPRHCSRHGLPAVLQRDFLLQSQVKIEGNRFLQVGGRGALGIADRLAQHGKKVRVAHVKDWPLCRKCIRARTWWLAVAFVLSFGGLAALVGSLVVGALTDGMPWLAGVAAGGFILMPLSAFPFVLGSLPRLTGARTAPDGASVIIENPSDAFIAELPYSG